jgi:hypothetical protein
MAQSVASSEQPCTSPGSNLQAIPTVHDAVPLEFGSSTNTRLLKIDLTSSPTTPERLISVRLHVISLDDPPPYTALSYTWGEPWPTQTILLDGKPFTVRQNLWDFLNQVQEVQYDGYLWIDALSIDQTSNPERDHQVMIMGAIFSRAAKTIVWLGTATEDVVKNM